MEKTEARIENSTIGKYKTQPKRHQQECLNIHGGKEAYGLFAEMGTGKTWIVLIDAANLWASGEIDSLFVVAPNGVHLNWLPELEAHMPEWVRYKAAGWSASMNKKERAEYESLYDSSEERTLRIFTMNWEALQNKKGIDAATRFLSSSGKAMIACDESIKMKNPKAKRTKEIMKLKKFSNYRRVMDGHPVGNSPFDLFTQFSFLDENILGTTSFPAFKAEYAEMLQEGNPLLDYIKKKGNMRFTPQVVVKDSSGRPKYRNLDKLNALIAPHMYRVLKKDCLDLPPKVYKTSLFKLTPAQAKIYKKAKEECRLVYEQEETPFNKLVALSKLSQITSGYYIHPLSEEPVRIEGRNPKLEILKDRVESIIEQGGQVIIWARYKQEIKDIVQELTEFDPELVVYNGDTKARIRPELIKKFESGQSKIFVGNQQAGGTGITLIAASHVIYFSNDFSVNNRLQSEDRAHRIGQDKSVVYLNIAAKGTVDQIVIRALAHKVAISDEILKEGGNRDESESEQQFVDSVLKELAEQKD